MNTLSDHKSGRLEAGILAAFLSDVRNMKLATTVGTLFLTALLCFFVPLQASALQPKEWTWKDAKRNVRSRADLDAILAQHDTWLDTSGEIGNRANLGGAQLGGADLTGADLTAHLKGAQTERHGPERRVLVGRGPQRCGVRTDEPSNVRVDCRSATPRADDVLQKSRPSYPAPQAMPGRQLSRAGARDHLRSESGGGRARFTH